MAGGFVSSMIKWAAEKLYSLIGEGAHGDGGLKDLQELQTMMERIYSVLKDGDERDNIPDHSERHRLKELKDVAYDADDVIDEYGYEVLRSQIEGPVITARNRNPNRNINHHKRRLEEAGEAGQLPCDPAALPVLDELSGRAREIRNKFEEIINCWEKLRWGERDSDRRVDLHCGIRPPSTSLVHKPDIHGRDKDRENVIKMLLSENRRGMSLVSVLPLTGMAGVGKTTLARVVYNDSKITEIFNLKGWVCVGGELDVRVVTRNILMSFTDKACDLTELQNLQRRLMEEVRGKRFFLVLDDVWNHDAIIWDSLRAPFVSAQSGTIIVTTYNTKVARVMQTMQPYPVEPLSFNDSWSLFKQSAFQYEGSYARDELLEIGRSIVRKCGGLPLAVKMVGAALRLEDDEDKWNDILASDLWESDSMKGAILPALKLSYDRMPIHLKQCFLFFSLFPKEFVFLKDKIIRLWMSLGLVQPERRKEIEEIGGDTFDGILQWSMIQQTQYEGVDGFVLHNMFHNLFQELVLEDFLIVGGGNHGLLNGMSQKVRYLSVLNNYPKEDCQNSIILGTYQSSRALRLLQILDPKNKWSNYHTDVKIHSGLFENLRRLRFLDFTDCPMEELPESIGNLKQLRYLCLTNTGIDKLHESICSLYNLQTLELIMCPLKKLPDGLKKLINLRHLNFQQWFPICMPSGIGRLVNLNTLPRFHVGKDDWHCDISELNGLVNLREELHISGLMNVSSVKSVRKANLRNKEYLKVLRLDWCDETSSHMCCDHGSSTSRANREPREHHSKVLERLEPHTNLKVLEIIGFPGYRYPSWLDRGSLLKLVKISLNGCGRDDCRYLPALGRLPSLKNLSIKSMWSLDIIGDEFIGFSDPKFNLLDESNVESAREDIFHDRKGIEHLEKSILFSPKFCSHDVSNLGFFPNFVSRKESNLGFSPKFCSPNKSRLVFPSLETLDFEDMRSWTKWFQVKIGDFNSLRKLKIIDCPKLIIFPKFSSTSLTTMEITDCNSIEVPDLPSIRSLTLKGKINGLIFSSTRMPLLRSLKVCHSSDIRSIGLNKKNIGSLEVLVIHNCRNLTTIVGLSDLKSLKLLKLSNCRSLKFSLDELVPRMLRRLHISNCPNLPEWEQIQRNNYRNQLSGKRDARDEDLEALAKLSDDEEETLQRLGRIAFQ